MALKRAYTKHATTTVNSKWKCEKLGLDDADLGRVVGLQGTAKECTKIITHATAILLLINAFSIFFAKSWISSIFEKQLEHS